MSCLPPKVNPIKPKQLPLFNVKRAVQTCTNGSVVSTVSGFKAAGRLNLSVSLLPMSVFLVGVPASLPQSKDMQLRLMCDSKLPVGVNVCLIGSFSLFVSPVMNWEPV